MTTGTFEVLPLQADFIEDEGLFSGARGGVGSGKTFSAQWKMWQGLRTYPKAGHYVVGADFEQLRGGYFLDFRELLEDLLRWKPGIDFRYKDTPRPEIILLDTGVRLRALSAELAERIRSTRIQRLHAEEPQTWHNGEQVWRTLVGRMRHSVRSAREYPNMPIAAWLTFNTKDCPIGSWLYKLVEEQWVAQGYRCYKFSLRDNYLLPNAAQYVANLEMTLPAHLVPVEIDGEWPTTGGGAYHNFDQSIHCGPVPAGLPAFGIRPQPLCWSLDFNVGFMCSVIAQWYLQQPILEYKGSVLPERRLPLPGWQERVWSFVDEITLPDAGIEDVCTEFLKRYGEHASKYGVYIYGDATGNSRHQAGSAGDEVRTNWQAVARRMRQAGIRVTWRVPSSNPAVNDRLYEVNAQCRAEGEGYGLLVDPLRCPELVTDLATNKVSPVTNTLDKSDKTPEGLRRTHTADAAGYLVYVERCLQYRKRSFEWSMGR